MRRRRKPEDRGVQWRNARPVTLPRAVCVLLQSTHVHIPAATILTARAASTTRRSPIQAASSISSRPISPGWANRRRGENSLLPFSVPIRRRTFNVPSNHSFSIRYHVPCVPSCSSTSQVVHRSNNHHLQSRMCASSSLASWRWCKLLRLPLYPTAQLLVDLVEHLIRPLARRFPSSAQMSRNIANEVVLLARCASKDFPQTPWLDKVLF